MLEWEKEFDEEFPIVHHYCDDTWYSCPKHPEGCANEYLDECNCGAEEYHERLKTFIKKIINRRIKC